MALSSAPDGARGGTGTSCSSRRASCCRRSAARSARVAYPLLVLALTGSAPKAGLVVVRAACCRARSSGCWPASLADRRDRRAIMLGADAVRAVALAALALLVALDPVFWPIPLLAFVEGAGDAFFGASARRGARSRAADAAGRGGERAAGADRERRDRRPAGRRGAVRRRAGGAVRGRRASRTRARSPRCSRCGRRSSSRTSTRPCASARAARRGLPLPLERPFLRATAFIYAVGNFTIPAFLFVLVVVARGHGLTGGEIGRAARALQRAASCSGRCSRRLRAPAAEVRAIVLVELYAGIVVLPT